MKTIVSVFAVLPFVLLTGLATETASGQSGTSRAAGSANRSHSAQSQVQAPATSVYRAPQGTASQVSSAAKIVGYRAPEWKSLHTTSSEEAEQTLATLKKIGCEVDTNNHGDHFDIKYRCPEWRSMKVKTHTLQSQWSSWCENQGMETVIVNPPAKAPTITMAISMRLLVALSGRRSSWFQKTALTPGKSGSKTVALKQGTHMFKILLDRRLANLIFSNESLRR